MNILKSSLLPLGVLISGLALAGLMMFAFGQNAQANEGNKGNARLEVAIGADGRALVRGAEITSIDGDTIYARTSWNSSSIAWTVRTDNDTNVVEKSGSGSDMDSFSVGDEVSFSGTLSADGSTFTVDADVVRNWSENSKNDDRPRNEVRAEVKADAKAHWGDWMKKMPVLNWFGAKHDNK